MNALNLVLVFALLAPLDTRSLIWNTANGTCSFVAQADLNLFPTGLTDMGTMLGKARDTNGESTPVISRAGGAWQPAGVPNGWEATGINNDELIVGFAKIDGLQRPWLQERDGKVVMLPYFVSHHTVPSSINDKNVIDGSASSDHGSHAVMWLLHN